MAIVKRKINRDGTQKVFSSPSYGGTYLYFTGKGDTEDEVGGGEPLRLTNTDGDTYGEIITGFSEDVYLKDGYIFWQNATVGDSVSLEVILPADTPYISSTETGNADMVDGSVKYITDSKTPDETWKGKYLLFPVDVTLFRFVNHFSLIGTNEHGLLLESTDAAEISKDLKVRLSFTSEAPNINLVVSVLMEMYRKNTI